MPTSFRYNIVIPVKVLVRGHGRVLGIAQSCCFYTFCCSPSPPCCVIICYYALCHNHRPKTIDPERRWPWSDLKWILEWFAYDGNVVRFQSHQTVWLAEQCWTKVPCNLVCVYWFVACIVAKEQKMGGNILKILHSSAWIDRKVASGQVMPPS